MFFTSSLFCGMILAISNLEKMKGETMIRIKKRQIKKKKQKKNKKPGQKPSGFDPFLLTDLMNLNNKNKNENEEKH